MKRTISLKLISTQDQKRSLLNLAEAFSRACTHAVFAALEHQEWNRVRLHHLIYNTLRSLTPELGSQMACNAIAKAARACKASKGKRNISFKELASVHFDKRTYSLKGNVLSLFTLEGRMKFEYAIGAFQEQYLKIGTPKEAELVRKGNRWFFNLVLDIPDVASLDGGKVMGIDFGENTVAATSTGKLIDGGKLRYDRDQFLSHRSRLQHNGSQSARQRLRQISGRERRHVKHVNHCVSKELVGEALRNGCSLIALEDLKNIRQRIRTGKRMRGRLHRWSFDELRCFVEYKAAAVGIRVVAVNPAYTSQTCSECSCIGIRQKHQFCCSNCGSLQHSDLNASRNLVKLGLSVDKPTGDVNRRHVAA